LRRNHQCDKSAYTVNDAANNQHVAPKKPGQTGFTAPATAKKTGSFRPVCRSTIGYSHDSCVWMSDMVDALV
jgi:hypothetical protein